MWLLFCWDVSLFKEQAGKKLTCYSCCFSNCEQTEEETVYYLVMGSISWMLGCPTGGDPAPRLSVLTARLLADDAVCAVSAGARLPQATVALDPEAGVWRQHGQGHLVCLPVAVGHLFILAPHQTPACSRNTATRHALSNLLGFLSEGGIISSSCFVCFSSFL